MNKLIKYAIRERRVTILISLFLILYGLYSYYFMPRQENPEVSSPGVMITTVFPGASSELVEKQVTSKIEDEVASLDKVDFIESYSQDNISIVFALLKTDADYEREFRKLRDNLDKLQADLPNNVQKININTDLTRTAGIIISLSSDKYDAIKLSEFAEDYRDKISQIEGINKVEIDGKPKIRVEIDVDSKKLDLIDISIDEIYNLILAQNVTIPAGSIKTSGGKINVNLPSSFQSLDDFRNLIIGVSKKTGSNIRLKDISNIALKTLESDTFYIKDKKASVLVTAYLEENKNIVLIGDIVRKEIEKLKPLYPDDLDIDEVLFLPQDVSNSIDNFLKNLLEGIVFVVIVIFIGMGIRNAIIVSIAIPMSIAMTFIYMGIFSLELHQVSIAALIIALGILVDNAIVISDAIQVYINQNISKKKAAFQGAKEQMIPVFTSTLTTLAAFTPLMSLPGSAGEFVSSLPLIVIVSLSSSFVVAMLVTPALSSMALKSRVKKIDLLAPIQKFYKKLMDINLARPIVSLSVVFILLASTVYIGYKTIDVKMFPYIDKNWLYLNVSNEIIGDIESTEKLVLELDDMLKSYDEITDTINAVGGGLPRYYMMSDFMMPSENNGTILAKFDLSKSKKFKKREDFIYDIQKRLDENFTGAYATAKMLEINIPGPNVEARISSDNEELSKKVASELYKFLQDSPATINVQKNESSYRYRYKVVIDEKKAISLGLNKYEIQNQINLALNGKKVSNFSSTSNTFDIFLKSKIKSIDDLAKLKIKSGITGKKLSLKSLASFSLEKEIDSIYKYNREKVISVSTDIRPGYGAGSVQKDVEDFLEKEKKNGISVSYGGDSQTMDVYLSGLITAAIFAIFLIYLILLIQFNSTLQPFIILFTVPLALIGIVWALIITSTNFTFTVGLAAASLIGIVVNNGILLIEYINRAREKNMPIKEACRDSVDKRIRAILLSSVTTIFGLIPLALGDSAFFTPMAISLMGGLIIATFMTITVIPTLYYVLSKKEKPNEKTRYQNSNINR